MAKKKRMRPRKTTTDAYGHTKKRKRRQAKKGPDGCVQQRTARCGCELEVTYYAKRLMITSAKLCSDHKPGPLSNEQVCEWQDAIAKGEAI